MPLRPAKTPATRMTIVEALRTHPVFAAAEASKVERLAASSTLVKYAPRQIIYTSGTKARRVYFLCTGTVRVFQSTPDGLETTVTMLMPPNAFGEKVILAESAGAPELGYPESTMAKTACEVIEIPKDDFLAFIHSDADAMRELLHDLACRFVASARREIDVLLPVGPRLASLLLSYVDVAGQAHEGGWLIKLKLTQTDFARGLGATERSIRRAFTTWKREGIVTTHKGWMLVRDKKKLEELCGADRLDMTYLYPRAKK